ncbi:MAG: hypothetical protein GXO48_09345 [Chlorobi bacterium]|nr:hypothetical protein [Chlorobiota bacterium]
MPWLASWGVIIAVFMSLLSCKPTYLADFITISVDTAYVYDTDSQYYLSNTSFITSLFASSGSENWGVFPVPGKMIIPCKEADSVRLFVRAGVRRNGQSGDQIPYFAYEPIDTKIICSTYSFQWTPVFRYVDTTKIRMLFREGFELTQRMYPMAGTIGYRQQEEVRSGNWAYLFRATKGQLVRTDTFHVEGASTTETFIEIDYKSDANFLIQAYLYGSHFPYRDIMVVFATEKWKKLYVDLSPLMAEGAKRMHVSFIFTEDSSGLRTLYLDNVKVLTRR